jgi:hypothetical protein
MWKSLPGSTRELELILVREMEFVRGRSSEPPDCFCVRVVGPFVKVARVWSGSFRADCIGFFVVLELSLGMRGSTGRELGWDVPEGRLVEGRSILLRLVSVTCGIIPIPCVLH